MSKIRLNTRYVKDFYTNEEFANFGQKAKDAYLMLKNKTGKGNEFLGWTDLPVNYDKEEFAEVLKASEFIQKNAEILVVIGIGGSYLGAQSAMSMLNPTFKKTKTEVIFVGHHLESNYVNELIEYIKDKQFCINVISKSGTTTEPAVMFRIFKNLIEEKYGLEESKKRIFATTDKEKGALRKLADQMGYKTFTVPANVGGRYSVLTSVGLLPIASSGLDIEKMMQGAKDAYSDLNNLDIDTNPALIYATIRNILYSKDKKIENIVGYNPKLAMFNEWWKQLFAESEGKDGLGIYTASAIFSTDLHSIGQMIQDGERNLFQTIINIKKSVSDIVVPNDSQDLDGLNFLAGKNVSFVNECAMKGTTIAHTTADVPNIILDIEKLDEYTYGYMVYFFMLSCGISGYILGVNPFNQEGVEAYKKNMFALLGKPGFEELKEKLEKNLK